MNPYDPNQPNPYNDRTTPNYPYTQYPPNPPPSKPWWQTTGGIIFLLLLFFPAGLVLMWMYAPWKPKTKWIVSGIVAVLLLIGAINNATAGTSTMAETASTQPTHVQQESQEVAPTATPTPKSTATPTPTPIPTEPPVPTQPPAPSCNGDFLGGTCYNTDPTGGAPVYATPPGFCGIHICVSTFNSNANGYIVECADTHWSHSGGITGACSRNGGVIATLYSH